MAKKSRANRAVIDSGLSPKEMDDLGDIPVRLGVFPVHFAYSTVSGLVYFEEGLVC